MSIDNSVRGNDDETNHDENEATSRSAIPLIAGAILLAQVTMSVATVLGGKLTERGIGRKPLFVAGLAILPIRCALIIYWKDAGKSYLLSTQILDGLSGGFLGLLHPYLVADITFGSGRFNLISKFNCVTILDTIFPMKIYNFSNFSGIDCILFRFGSNYVKFFWSNDG